MPVDLLLRVLLVEGNLADARWLEEQLRDSRPPWCTLTHARTLASAIDMVREGRIDAVLLDLSLPDAPGIEAVARMRAAAPNVPAVVLKGLDDEQTALRAVKEGAQDYLLKDQVSAPLLARAIRYAIERKRADESQRREAAAAQTAQLREQFVAVLGHDLRNPLSSIAMSAGLLLKNAELNERQLRAVARIASSADRMNRMIRDLLDFTRTRLGGGYSLLIAPGSLRDICRQVVEELETVHHDRTLIFTAEHKCWGEWDADRMAQLASNLISNGLQYSPPESPVHILLRQEVRTASESGTADGDPAATAPRTDGKSIPSSAGVALLEVTNQGAAIPEEMIPVLFEPFYRVQARATGAASQGLGLGLYIAHQIVLAHRGRMVVRSDAEHGTTFSVRLPLTQKPL